MCAKTVNHAWMLYVPACSPDSHLFHSESDKSKENSSSVEDAL